MHLFVFRVHTLLILFTLFWENVRIIKDTTSVLFPNVCSFYCAQPEAITVHKNIPWS